MHGFGLQQKSMTLYDLNVNSVLCRQCYCYVHCDQKAEARITLFTLGYVESSAIHRLSVG